MVGERAAVLVCVLSVWLVGVAEAGGWVFGSVAATVGYVCVAAGVRARGQGLARSLVANQVRAQLGWVVLSVAIKGHFGKDPFLRLLEPAVVYSALHFLPQAPPLCASLLSLSHQLARARHVIVGLNLLFWHH